MEESVEISNGNSGIKILASTYPSTSTPPTTNTGINSVENHFDENYSFVFKKVTNYTKEEITEFWKNKTNGVYCTNLFIEIYNKYDSISTTVDTIKAKIDEYNQKCSLKCMPGYVICENDKSGKCVTEDSCCKLNNKVTCNTANHPIDSHNYATSNGDTLYCYDWCCPES